MNNGSGSLDHHAQPSIRMMDADAHEMIPMHMWADAFGEQVAELFAPLSRGLVSKAGANSTFRPDIVADDAAINIDSVWNRKGPDAPSAIDLQRRLAVMDVMGVERQLVFPTFALIGINIFYNEDAAAHFKYEPGTVDRKAAGRLAIDGHNDWAVRQTGQLGSQRVRPVGVVLTESLPEMMSSAEKLLADGIRALWIPNGEPPAGTSPADPALAPFWTLAESADAPILLHVGTQFAFCKPAWYANVPAFEYGPKSSVEFPIEPYRASTIHLAVEAFLGAMVLGGVFERHPRLRLGVVECGAHWVGPLAEKLDLWGGLFQSRLKGTLSMRPSEYIARNVRVTPFHFEPVGAYMQRHPELSDVYCFGSDFPHVEGGKSPQEQFRQSLAGLGDDIARKFFVTNGELLLPA